MIPRFFLTVLITTVVLACSDGSDRDSSVGTQPLVEPSEQAAVFGPHPVGHQRLEAIDVNRGNRQLPYDVWYPVDQADATDEPRTIYPLLGPIGLTAELAVEDLPVSSSGPYALLIFSHGSRGTNTQSVLLMETLASHGFIVVSPEHTGNTNSDPSDSTDEAGARRVPDVSFMIDTFLARNDIQGDEFFERINADAIGVLGHSFGGGTALGMVAGFYGVPADDRVTAAMGISATIEGRFTRASLEAVTRPVMLMGGTLDTSVPIREHALAFEQLTAAEAVFKIDIVGATHTHFANICDIGNYLLENSISQELWPDIGAAALLEPYRITCSEDAFPIAEAQRIQNLYAVAFFRRYLRGEAPYDFYLQDKYAQANEPDIDYQSRIIAP